MADQTMLRTPPVRPALALFDLRCKFNPLLDPSRSRLARPTCQGPDIPTFQPQRGLLAGQSGVTFLNGASCIALKSRSMP